MSALTDYTELTDRFTTFATAAGVGTYTDKRRIARECIDAARVLSEIVTLAWDPGTSSSDRTSLLTLAANIAAAYAAGATWTVGTIGDAQELLWRDAQGHDRSTTSAGVEFIVGDGFKDRQVALV